MSTNKNIKDTPKWLIDLLSASTPANDNLTFLAEGQRNTDLTSLAGFLKRKSGMDPATLNNYLQASNNVSTAPLSSEEVLKIAESIGNKDNNKIPRFDDVSMSTAFASYIEHSFRWTPETDWMSFKNGKWCPDQGSKLIQEQAKRFVKLTFESVKSLEHNDQKEVMIKAARQYLTAAKIDKIAKLASSDPRILCSIEDFDAKKNLINFPNGALNLDTNNFYPHNSSDLLTRMANVEFNPDAKCPCFSKLLEDSLPKKYQKFLLRLLGYSLTGEPKEQIFVILYGAGANGKSTVMNIIESMFGDYAINSEPSVFTGKNNGIPNDVARFKGPRLILTTELTQGEYLNAALIKRLTGGDIISARFLHREFFDFKPIFTLFMVTNALPIINGTDSALARRIILLPFDNIIPPENRDNSLPYKLETEKSGIFNLILDGLNDYNKNGLAIPHVIEEKIISYVKRSDLIESFLQEEIEKTPLTKVMASQLYQSYKNWSHTNGYKPLSSSQFKYVFSEKTGLEQVKENTGNYWHGIKLKNPYF